MQYAAIRVPSSSNKRALAEPVQPNRAAGAVMAVGGDQWRRKSRSGTA